MAQLLKEVKADNTAKVLELLQSSSHDLNQVDPKTGDSLIHLAIKNANSSILSNLVSKDRSNHADPNLENEDGLTPLICAVDGNYLEGVDILLRSGAKLNAKLSDGRNALHFAAELSSQDILKRLLRAGIDVNANSSNLGGTPLHIAIIEMNYESALLLLEHKDINLLETNSDGETPLHLAVINGAGEIVQKILSMLEERDDKELSISLLNSKNKKGNTALHEGESHKRPTICNMLSTRGVKLGLDLAIRNKEGKTAEEIKLDREKMEEDERKRAQERKMENIQRNRQKNDKKKTEQIELQRQEEEREIKQKLKMESAQKQVAFLERFGPIFILIVVVLGLIGMYVIFKIREEQGEIIDLPMEDDDDEY